MSDTQDDAEKSSMQEPMMFPPVPESAPSGRAAPEHEHIPAAAREAALDAVERALAASVRLSRLLPVTPTNEPEPEKQEAPRQRAPSDDEDPAIRRLRKRLEPIVLAVPVAEERGSGRATLAWVAGGVALAALVVLLAGDNLSLPFGAKAEGRAVSPVSRIQSGHSGALTSAPVLAEESAERAAPLQRVAALAPPPAEQPAIQQAAKAEPVAALSPPSPPPEPPPPQRARVLDRDEITTLYERSMSLVEQGDIASARLMLTRAAEAGDASSALALGATYDPDVLRKLGVLGVAPDPARAQSWYTKAVELGSAEAVLRLERLATR